MANPADNEKEVKSIYDIPVDSKLTIKWSDIENSMGRKIPLEDKKRFVEEYGTEMQVVELLKVWSRLASMSLGASVGGAIGGLVAKLTGSLTLGFGSLISVLITVACVVYSYHLHLLKEIPHRKQNVTEQYVFLNEGFWEKYIKNPTINAGRQAATFVMSKIKAVWDYFFGEKDVVFNNIVVRRRRQFMLFVGIVGLIALINNFHAYSDFMAKTGKMWFPRRWYNRYLTFPGVVVYGGAAYGGYRIADKVRIGKDKK